MRKAGKYEQMEQYMWNMWAVIIDTDQPITDHYAHCLCAFTTGIRHTGNSDFMRWAQRFFKEMHIDPHVNPFSKYKSWARDGNGMLWAASPWPSEEYAHDGKSDYVNIFTQKKINGVRVSEEEILERYTWPARLSVAIFFSKEIHSLKFGTIRGRSETFCKSYANDRSGTYHKVIRVRQCPLKDLPFSGSAGRME